MATRWPQKEKRGVSLSANPASFYIFGCAGAIRPLDHAYFEDFVEVLVA
jgi:hypothetical protein